MIPTAWRLTLKVERIHRCGLTSVIDEGTHAIPAEGSHRWSRPYKNVLSSSSIESRETVQVDVVYTLSAWQPN
jgi:hypothetical protein